MGAFQALVFVAGVTLLVAVGRSNAQLSHGATCGHPNTQFCSKESGLICGDDFKCTCSHGVIATGLEYSLEWDATQSKCLAKPESPCFGTKEFPVPEGQNSAICSSNYECTALKDLPPGTGLCKPKITLQSFGVTCGKDTFCDKAAGLMCNEDFTCGCSKGVVSDELEYKFTWNATAGKCLAEENSACHTDPSVAVAQCAAELVCTQVEDTVPGVGECKSQQDKNSGSAGLVGLNTLLLTGIALVLLHK